MFLTTLWTSRRRADVFIFFGGNTPVSILLRFMAIDKAESSGSFKGLHST